jgi:hypothetical protein
MNTAILATLTEPNSRDLDSLPWYIFHEICFQKGSA